MNTEKLTPNPRDYRAYVGEVSVREYIEQHTNIDEAAHDLHDYITGEATDGIFDPEVLTEMRSTDGLDVLRWLKNYA